MTVRRSGVIWSVVVVVAISLPWRGAPPLKGVGGRATRGQRGGARHRRATRGAVRVEGGDRPRRRTRPTAAPPPWSGCLPARPGAVAGYRPASTAPRSGRGSSPCPGASSWPSWSPVASPVPPQDIRTTGGEPYYGPPPYYGPAPVENSPLRPAGKRRELPVSATARARTPRRRPQSSFGNTR